MEVGAISRRPPQSLVDKLLPLAHVTAICFLQRPIFTLAKQIKPSMVFFDKAISSAMFDPPDYYR